MSRLLRLMRRRVRAGNDDTPPVTPSIAASLSGSAWYLQRGTSASRTLTLTRTAYPDPVSVSVSGLPSGVTATVTPSTLTGATFTASIQLSASSGAALTTTGITVTVSGTGVDPVLLFASVTVAVAPTFGPGPNAPAWADKSVYPEELFLTPIPVQYASPNAAGFKGYQGFDGAWGGDPYLQQRVSYPVVSTPLGTKPVMQVMFPGSTTTLTAAGQTTPAWAYNDFEQFSARVMGAWSGNLIFETSTDDGATWQPTDIPGLPDADGTLRSTRSSTTENGLWGSSIPTVTSGKFRVRAATLTSGAATVRVGMLGGAAPARFDAGAFNPNHTRVYFRVLLYLSPNWDNGDNSGTKFSFVSSEGYGHYTALFGNDGVSSFVGLQGPGNNRNIGGPTLAARGTWVDVEFVWEGNTPGVANGKVRGWINNTSGISADDVLWFLEGAPGFWTALFCDPTYGGGVAPPPANIFFQLAGWYRESAP